jgi:D-aminopeptidase
MTLYEPALPLEGEIDFRLPIQADYAAVLPGAARIGGRTVGFGAPDGDAFYRTFLALTRLAATPVIG